MDEADELLMNEAPECHWRRTARVARASDVARLVAPPVPGDEVMLKFGKIFEEEYSYANYICYKSFNRLAVPRRFIRKIAARLRERRAYTPVSSL